MLAKLLFLDTLLNFVQLHDQRCSHVHCLMDEHSSLDSTSQGCPCSNDAQHILTNNHKSMNLNFCCPYVESRYRSHAVLATALAAAQTPRSIPRLAPSADGAGPSGTAATGTAAGDHEGQDMMDMDGDMLDDDSPGRGGADENRRPRVNAAAAKPPLAVTGSRGGGGGPRQSGIMEAFARGGGSQRWVVRGSGCMHVVLAAA